MHTTSLRNIDGSIMLAVPPAILDVLHLKAGAIVGLAIDGELLVVDPKAKPHYTLAELLQDSNHVAGESKEEAEWLQAPATGRELL